LDGVVGEKLSTVVYDGLQCLARTSESLRSSELTVEVVGTANVMTGNDGDEGSSSVRASGLYTSKCIGGDSSGRPISVAPGLDTSVDTSGVGTPELNIGIRHRLASCHVDDVEVEMSYSTLLTSEDVLADKFATDP
jgi:hypothetical protein